MFSVHGNSFLIQIFPWNVLMTSILQFPIFHTLRKRRTARIALQSIEFSVVAIASSSFLHPPLFAIHPSHSPQAIAIRRCEVWRLDSLLFTNHCQIHPASSTPSLIHPNPFRFQSNINSPTHSRLRKVRRYAHATSSNVHLVLTLPLILPVSIPLPCAQQAHTILYFSLPLWQQQTGLPSPSSAVAAAAALPHPVSQHQLLHPRPVLHPIDHTSEAFPSQQPIGCPWTKSQVD